MQTVGVFLLHMLDSMLLTFGFLAYERQEELRERVERRPLWGSYPRGNSLWARLNRPVGRWKD